MRDEPIEPVDPIDPDVDLADPWQRTELRRHELRTLGAIAVGGVLGAEARYGLARLWPHTAAGFPWATWVTNVLGCLLMGVLMVVLVEVVPRPHPLARPFLGVGILGGFTTFSTFAVDTDRLLHLHHGALAVGYVLASVAGCVVAVAGAATLTRSALVR